MLNKWLHFHNLKTTSAYDLKQSKHLLFKYLILSWKECKQTKKILDSNVYT